MREKAAIQTSFGFNRDRGNISGDEVDKRFKADTIPNPHTTGFRALDIAKNESLFGVAKKPIRGSSSGGIRLISGL